MPSRVDKTKIYDMADQLAELCRQAGGEPYVEKDGLIAKVKCKLKHPAHVFMHYIPRSYKAFVNITEHEVELKEIEGIDIFGSSGAVTTHIDIGEFSTSYSTVVNEIEFIVKPKKLDVWIS